MSISPKALKPLLIVFIPAMIFCLCSPVSGSENFIKPTPDEVHFWLMKEHPYGSYKDFYSENITSSWNRTRGYGNLGIGNGSLMYVTSPKKERSTFSKNLTMQTEITTGDPAVIKYGKVCEGICKENPRDELYTNYVKLIGLRIGGANISIGARIKD